MSVSGADQMVKASEKQSVNAIPPISTSVDSVAVASPRRRACSAATKTPPSGIAARPKNAMARIQPSCEAA